MKHSRLPQFDSDRCVHGLLVDASCSACATVCPHQAILLDDDQLGLDENACDGCGICENACPVSAIEIARGDIALSDLSTNRTAYPVCRHSGDTAGHAMSCVQAMGIRDLCALYERGVRHIEARAPCADCKAEPCLETAVSDFNKLTESRGLDGLTLAFLPRDHWIRATSAVFEPTRLENPSRRALFSKFTPDKALADERIFDLAPAYDTGLPETRSENPIHMFVPGIDPSRCNGCDACWRACPTPALTLINDETQTTRYVVDAGHCVGCRLCLDACDREAVSLLEFETQKSHGVELESGTCARCGVNYYRPPEYSGTNNVCWICDKRGHENGLYQKLT